MVVLTFKEQKIYKLNLNFPPNFPKNALKPSNTIKLHPLFFTPPPPLSKNLAAGQFFPFFLTLQFLRKQLHSDDKLGPFVAFNVLHICCCHVAISQKAKKCFQFHFKKFCIWVWNFTRGETGDCCILVWIEFTNLMTGDDLRVLMSNGES